MSVHNRLGRLSDRRGTWLMIILIVATYVGVFSSGFAQFSLVEIGVLIFVGVLYSLITIYDEPIRARLGIRWGTVAYFGIQLTLATAFIYVSRAQGWLIMMPLVSQSVMWLPRRWMLVTCAAILAGMGLAIGLFLTTIVGPEGDALFPPNSANFWLSLLQNMLAYAAAIAFVIIFTRIAVREREARDEVERLAAELRGANRQLREYAIQAGELATLKERTRLAREIHDGLGHYLTAINMQIQAGRD